MGLNIGGLLKDVGVNLPKIDLGNIGKSVLDEGKKLLGDVVKDSFTLSNQPGQTFASDMNLNILGDNVRLPNPIGSLANKLLGSADGELNKFGVNVDFKSLLGKLFKLPTESGTTATVPPVKDRAATGQIPAATASTTATAAAAASAAPGAAATGGGSVVASDAISAAPGANATGGGAVASTSTSGDALMSGLSGVSSMESSLESQLGQAATGTGKMTIAGNTYDLSDPAQKGAALTAIQMQMQTVTEMMNTISNIMNDEHQSRMNTIANIKG